MIVSGLLLLFGINLRISRVEGLIFLGLFIYFLINTVKNAKNNALDGEEEEAAITAEVENIVEFSIPKTILLSVIGIAGIILGGDMVVDSATKIATTLGMSANLVGLTIVAVGTSYLNLLHL